MVVHDVELTLGRCWAYVAEEIRTALIQRLGKVMG